MATTDQSTLVFLTHSSADADSWPFFQVIRESGAEVVVFGRSVSLRYRRRIWLALVGWPKLFLSGLSLAQSAISSLPKDCIVTANDHILLLCFKLVRLVRPSVWQTRHKLVLHGFIYTRSKSLGTRILKKIYFGLLLRNIDLVICHSRHEIEPIRQIGFRGRYQVRAVHYGIGEGKVIKAWWDAYKDKPSAFSKTNTAVRILSAGRSSRDYATLRAALDLLGSKFHCDVICDNVETAPQEIEAPNFQIHRSVYGDQYTQMILNADIVVIPLSAGEISAGQMVLLHALAAGRPVIISETPTSSEYIKNGDLLKLPELGNASALAEAVTSITQHFPLGFQQRNMLRQLFEERFSDRAHGLAVFEVYQEIFQEAV